MTQEIPDPVINRVLGERTQGPDTRKKILADLENTLKMPVLLYFTSFRYPVMIDDSDADILEATMQSMDLSSGLVLLISSPGGSGLTAERIIKACRSYSETDEYVAVVPGKAKSAATMICFGASKIMMGPTSELGPIDPQVSIKDGGQPYSVYNVIQSYDNLFSKAVKTKGKLEPYLQQLEHYDEREIEEFRMALSLSEDIAIKSLASGMMEGIDEDEIKKKIATFLTPKQTKTHGRPIYRDEAKKCGLNIDILDHNNKLWRLIYELYIRTNSYVNTFALKCIETKNHAYSVNLPQKQEEKA